MATGPTYGGRLAYTATSVTETLHPYRATATGPRAVVGPIYESLLSLDYQLEGETVRDYRVDYPVRPMLAEGWRQTHDSTYVFAIRKGIAWHDGVAFTASDVAFSYNHLKDPKNAFPLRSSLGDVAGVEVVDPYNVKITTNGPAPGLLTSLADLNVMVIPKHVFDRGDDFDRVAVGTGPFKYSSFDRTGTSVFARNDVYWQPGRPYMDGLQVFYGLDQSSRNAAFVAKRVDFRGPADRVLFNDILKLVPDARHASIASPYGWSMLMKLDRPPFEDIRVRRAVHLAVDRQALLKVVAFDVGAINPPGVPAMKTGWAIPQEELLNLPGYRQPKDQDIAEAKRLLAEAGYGGGLRASVLCSQNHTFTARIAEAMASQLKAVGIDLEIRTLPIADLRKATQEGRYDTYMDAVGDPKPEKAQVPYLHSKGALNTQPVNDARLDALIDTQRTSLDPGASKLAALELQRLLLDKLYVIPTIDPASFQVWHPWVKGYVYNLGTSEIVDQENAASVWLDVEKMPADRR